MEEVTIYATAIPDDNDNGDDPGNGDGLTGQPCPGMPTFTDPRDGNVYNTVLIGDQCWMKENLRYLPEVSPPPAGNYRVYGYYGTDFSEAIATENYQNYGVLYNWNAAMNGEESSNENPSGVQGACPSGWHLPSNKEWNQLINYLMDEYDMTNVHDSIDGVGNALKSCRQIDSPLGGECSTSQHPRWNSTTRGYGTDQFGFSGLPSGYFTFNKDFNNLGDRGYWWTSTEHWIEQNGQYMLLIKGTGRAHMSYGRKIHGYSIRCVRDVD